MGSNLDHARGVLEQGTFTIIASLHPGVNGVPARTELVVVFD